MIYIVWPDGSYIEQDNYNCYEHGGKGEEFYIFDAEDEDELLELMEEEGL